MRFVTRPVATSIHDAFVAELSKRVDQLRVGSGIEDGVSIHPMINANAITKIGAHVEDAIQKGAGRTTRGRNLPKQFADPTVLPR